MKERLHYIDAAKGLLILMVAYGHVYYTICHNYGYNNIHMTTINNISNAWIAFYMPAFFVITGMCSNFNKDIKPFVCSLIKTILLPAFTLALIIHAIEWLLADKDFYIGLKVFLKGTSYWFLFALFVAKTIYYVLNKYLKSLKKIGIVTLVLYCIFGVVHEYLPNIPNYWCWIHALGLIPFLTLGQILKKQNVLDNKKVVAISGGGIFSISCFIHYFRNKDTKNNWRNIYAYNSITPTFSDVSYRLNFSVGYLQIYTSGTMA